MTHEERVTILRECMAKIPEHGGWSHNSNCSSSGDHFYSCTILKDMTWLFIVGPGNTDSVVGLRSTFHRAAVGPPNDPVGFREWLETELAIVMCLL